MNNNTIELIERASGVESALKALISEISTGRPIEKANALLDRASVILSFLTCHIPSDHMAFG